MPHATGLVSARRGCGLVFGTGQEFHLVYLRCFVFGFSEWSYGLIYNWWI